MAESFSRSPETITMLLFGYTLIQNKKFKRKKKSGRKRDEECFILTQIFCVLLAKNMT